MSSDPNTPVGRQEIAAALGVEPDTVTQWRRRGLGFPEPCWTVNGAPAWRLGDVLAWHRSRTTLAHRRGPDR